MSIKLKKNWFIITFSIVLFLINLGIAKAELVITVKYNDGCFVDGAFVEVWEDMGTNDVCAGWTNIYGKFICPTSSLNEHGCPPKTKYWVQIFKPDDEERWFREAYVDGACYGVADATLPVSCLSMEGKQCVDGYCCDSACADTCKACNIAPNEGTCSFIPSGQDPVNECPEDSCKYGVCDGFGACAMKDTSELCNSDFRCSDSIGGDNKYNAFDYKKPSQGYCDGLGNCDWSIAGGTTCTWNPLAAVEGSGITKCINGQSSCSNTCSDGLDNDNNGCIDSADSQCGGTDTICNGLDDDCDGSTDEDYIPSATTCGLGVCQSAGMLICVNGNVQDSCVPGPPTGSDNDCNGLDDDCDNQVNEHYVPTSTECGLGVCHNTGQLICVGGSLQDTCTQNPPTGSDNDCNGLDDDCDGSTDEDYIPSATTCGLGVCQSAGMLICVNGNVQDGCVPGLPTETPEVSCDNLVDDDCDNLIDCNDANCAGIPPCGDTTPPIVTLLYPKNTNYYFRWILLVVKVDEPTSWIGYSLDEQDKVTLWTNKPAGTYFKLIYVPTYGSHNIIVYANDHSGNIGSSDKVYFTIREIRWGFYDWLYTSHFT